MIWSGDGRGGCSDPNLGPPCSASSLDLVNRAHVLHELARPDGVPERYLERIRDQATRRYVAAEIAHLALARTGVSDEADEPAEPHRAGLAYPC